MMIRAWVDKHIMGELLSCAKPLAHYYCAPASIRAASIPSPGGLMSSRDPRLTIFIKRVKRKNEPSIARDDLRVVCGQSGRSSPRGGDRSELKAVSKRYQGSCAARRMVGYCSETENSTPVLEEFR